MRTPPSFRAAWAPARDTHEDEDAAIANARGWLQAQGDDLGGQELLVSHSKQPPHGIPALSGLTIASTKSAVSRTAKWLVLVWVTDEVTLEDAQRYAHRRALAVLESPNFPLLGWARATSAVNLITGDVAPPYEGEAARLLDRLEHAANNGYTHQYGKQTAQRIVPRLITAGVRPAEIVGYVTAYGQSVNSIRALQKVLTELGHDPTS